MPKTAATKNKNVSLSSKIQENADCGIGIWKVRDKCKSIKQFSLMYFCSPTPASLLYSNSEIKQAARGQ